MNYKTVLITGGSSGIGYEMSRLFAPQVEQLLWVSHLENEMEEAQKRLKVEFPQLTIHTLLKDLTQIKAPQEVYNWVKENHWTIDVLVNNAGIGFYGDFMEIDMEKEIRVIQLNVMALYALTRLFLKDMLERNSGKILNMSSSASFQPLPKFTTYAATKAFVRSFSAALDEELKNKKSRVRVITICPAAVNNTPFQGLANAQRVRTFSSIGTTTAEEVAKDALKALKLGKRVMLTGAKYRLMMNLKTFMPPFLSNWIVKRELERVK
ncbi:MAG: SDR family oxidoreductase [Microscillaceae bacterium]|nr:SDR family oxidoreductase [Microscillaceae bacterium]